MTQILEIGRPPIPVAVRRSKRARRLSLRVSGIDGKVSLTLPQRGTQREAVAFLTEKEPWIRKHLEKQPVSQQIEFGSEIPVEGQMRRVQPYDGKAVTLEAFDLLVPDDPRKVGGRIEAFLKVFARDRLAAASQGYADRIGKPFGKITLRDTRSRWGSCTSKGDLMYSWRLILAPAKVLDYVAAHEVSHLAEMNHSRAFWDHVGALMPDYEEPRAWLREHGAKLHRFQFKN